MQNDRIPVDKMITLVQDGPYANITIFWHMNELILQDHPEFLGLIDLGSCTIHIHNALGKELTNMAEILTSFTWILISCSNTVQLDVRTLKMCR